MSIYTDTKFIINFLRSLSAAVAPSGTARPRSSSFSTAAGANPAPVRVGLLGARGYVGMELLRLVASHPTYELAAASSRSLKGQNVGEPGDGSSLRPW